MFKSFPSKGYFIDYLEKIWTTKANHTFCGVNDVEGGTCPNCDKPLLLLLKLQIYDQRLELEWLPFNTLNLCFCWTCNIAQSPFFYEIDPNGGIHLLVYGKGGCVRDFPYENYPIHFPGSIAKLTEISDADQELIIGLNSDKVDEWKLRKTHPELCEPRHQIGGQPYWVIGNPQTDLQCIKCGSIMPFFANIADDAADGLKFTGNAYVQTLFFLCPKCVVVGAYQQCD